MDVGNVAVVGEGAIGRGIAVVVMKGFYLELTDISEVILKKAVESQNWRAVR